MSERPRFSRLDLEEALIDAEGDFLLLALAIAAVSERADEARRAAYAERGPPAAVAGLATSLPALSVQLSEWDLTALTHAKNRVEDALTKMSAVFYGPAT